jgi:dTDP-6-deoxy-L-talose 4-dehydrogenase (NAD+)
MNRVLLTGATGFVGRQVLRCLTDSEVTIRLIARSDKEKHLAKSTKIEKVFLTHNLFQEHPSWWESACRDVDIVIHCAWYAEPGQYLQALQNIDCLIGSLNMAKGAAAAGVNRIVGVGTCFEYDLIQGVLSIQTPLKPTTAYAGSKAALFLTLTDWLATQNISFSWCRLFYLYGEGEDERRLVPYIRKQLEKGWVAELTSGTQIRDYLDVVDAGRLIAKIALGNQCGPVNVCSGTPITVRQLAEQIADEYGRRDLLRFGVRPENMVDPPCILGIPNHGLP